MDLQPAGVKRQIFFEIKTVGEIPTALYFKKAKSQICTARLQG